MQIKKSPFILIEVLIAITLLSLLLVPIASLPYKTYQKELLAIESLELSRLQENLFGDFMQTVHEKVACDVLEKVGVEESLGLYQIDLPPIGSFPYKANYTLEIKNDYTSKEKVHYYLIDWTLTLSPLKKGSFTPPSVTYSFVISQREETTANA